MEINKHPEKAAHLIAVVDDDISVRTALGRFLRLAGFEVRTFESGEAFLRGGLALELCCVVMDVHLGGLTGLEVKAQLERSGCLVPAIFITADHELAQRLQPSLKKPFAASQLIDMIRQTMPVSM